mgnify:CR=1 FL=1
MNLGIKKLSGTYRVGLTSMLLFLLSCSTARNLKEQKIKLTPPEIETFAAILNLKGDTNKGKIKLNLELFYKKNGSLIFYPHTSWGSGFFKAKLQEDTLTIYFPEDQKYYRDDIENFQEKTNWGWEIKLKELMEMIVEKNLESSERAEISYKKFKKYEAYDLPSEIELKFKSTSKKIKVKFKEQRINPDLEDKIFQLEIPEEAQRVDLVEE